MTKSLKKTNTQKLDSIYRQETVRTVGVCITIVLQVLILLYAAGVLG